MQISLCFSLTQWILNFNLSDIHSGRHLLGASLIERWFLKSFVSKYQFTVVTRVSHLNANHAKHETHDSINKGINYSQKRYCELY